MSTRFYQSKNVCLTDTDCFNHYLIKNGIFPFVSQGYYITYFLFCKYPKIKSMQSTMHTFSNFDLANSLLQRRRGTTKWWMRRSPLGCISRGLCGFCLVTQGFICNETRLTKDVKPLNKREILKLADESV